MSSRLPDESRDRFESEGTISDNINSYRLPTTFSLDYIEHRITYSDRDRGIRKKIKKQRWVHARDLGRGGFGVVKLQMEQKSRQLRAVKEVARISAEINPLRELVAMAALSKDESNFVQMHGWFENETHLFIAMEYFEHGDLRQCVTEALPEQECQMIIFQVTEALKFMHERNFVHRDLKPSNIFVARAAPRWWVKVADFGISKRHSEFTALHTNLGVGSEFAAPELIGLTEDVTMTSAVDMWSTGCIATWLSIHDLLLRGARNLFLFSDGRLPLPLDKLESKGLSAIAINFISSTLSLSPSNRLTAATALEHAWLLPYSTASDTDDTSSTRSVNFVTTELAKSLIDEVSNTSLVEPQSIQIPPLTDIPDNTVDASSKLTSGAEDRAAITIANATNAAEDEWSVPPKKSEEDKEKLQSNALDEPSVAGAEDTAIEAEDIEWQAPVKKGKRGKKKKQSISIDEPSVFEIEDTASNVDHMEWSAPTKESKKEEEKLQSNTHDEPSVLGTTYTVIEAAEDEWSMRTNKSTKDKKKKRSSLIDGLMVTGSVDVAIEADRTECSAPTEQSKEDREKLQSNSLGEPSIIGTGDAVTEADDAEWFAPPKKSKKGKKGKRSSPLDEPMATGSVDMATETNETEWSALIEKSQKDMSEEQCNSLGEPSVTGNIDAVTEVDDTEWLAPAKKGKKDKKKKRFPSFDEPSPFRSTDTVIEADPALIPQQASVERLLTESQAQAGDTAQAVSQGEAARDTKEETQTNVPIEVPLKKVEPGEDQWEMLSSIFGRIIDLKTRKLYSNALQVASVDGHERAVQMLLDKGADVNAQGGYFGNALQAASWRGHEKVVQMLLDKGADVNAQGGEYGNALQVASRGGHENVVQILLDKGADVNAQGGYYGNALQAASCGGHVKVVQILLDKGADVNAQGGDYGNALQAASWHGREKVVQMLLDKGADVNAQGGYYGNALQAASGYGHEKVVQMLLGKGADVNARGGHFGSALKAAADNGYKDLVQILVERGADESV